MLRLYYRYSPRPDETGDNSITRQRRECMKYIAAKHSVKHYVEYEDRDVSGGTLKRPDLQRLFSDLQPGDIVVASAHDRLARDMGVFAAIRQAVTEAGATIEYADGTTPEDTPEGRLISGIFALFAEYERDRTRTRTKKAMARKRKGCQLISGHVPIGWKVREILIADHGEEKEIVKQLVRCESEVNAIISACAFRLQFKWRWDFIVNELNSVNSELVKTGEWECRSRHDGKPWTIDSVRKMVKKNKHWAFPTEGARSRMPKTP